MIYKERSKEVQSFSDIFNHMFSGIQGSPLNEEDLADLTYQ